MKRSKLLTIPRAATRMLLATLLLTMTAQMAGATDKTLSGSESYTAQDGDVLTGSTSGTVTIAGNASITLNNATITGGIVCNGSATITLVGTNSVTGASDKAGIQPGGSGTTLTINGDGSLTVTGGSGYNTYQGSAGIGASYGASSSSKSICGNITINGGTINATGGYDAAGIGAGGPYSECGNILITGGTVTATGGGSNAAGIGTGCGFSSGTKSSICGNITITCGTISATKSGSGASHSIGIGKYGTCGIVTIGGVEGYISTSPYNKTIVDDKYAVHFDANGGTGTMSNQTINRGTATALTRNTFTRDGYVFIGWSETADGDVVYTDCKEVTDLAEKDATKTLYAKWMSTSAIPAGFQVDAEYAQTEAGFYFVNMPIGEATTTITISDVSTKFKIYDDGGKNGNATKGGKGYLTINVPTGYKVSLSGSVLAPETLFSVILIAYDGNSSSAAELGSFYRSNPVSTSSTGNCITLYFWGNGDGDFAGLDLTAEVTPITYNITYNGVDGATFETENPATYTIESGAITLNNPTKDGYTFAGWTGTDLGAATTSVTIAHGSTGDRSYTATWNIITYNITYNGVEGATNPNPADYTIESEAITLDTPTKDGYTFAGWFDNAEFTGSAVTTITAGSTGDKTFWAKWKKSLENGDITIAAIADQEWTGSEIKPTALVVVKDGETVITDQCDISFSNNTNVGTATVNITAKANSTGYAGTKNDVTFKIVAKPATIAGVSGGPLSFTQDQNGYTAIFDGTSETDLNITATVAVKDVKINREFHSGQASTVMLPFDYTCNNGEGGKFYAFVGVAWNDSENKWEATMKEPGDGTNQVTTLTANTPYLFMPSGTEMTFPNIPNMTDGTVTLKPASEGGNCSGTSGDANWEFHGTYTKKTWTSSDSDKDYGFAATSGTATDGTTTITAGQFVRFAPGAWMKPMRCYLSYIGTSAPAPARGVTRAAGDGLPQSITVRLVSRGGETTAIGTLDTQTGELSFDGWYDMNGRKLDGKPTKKGLYINNGHKVVIK